MIQPDKITNYNLTHPELEEHILFWVAAAGKNGMTAARYLQKLLDSMIVWYGPKSFDHKHGITPFKIINNPEAHLETHMKDAGIGCYKAKANTYRDLAKSGLNLKTCSAKDLEQIKGIGKKTSRCFILHSRPNQQYAGLDIHILKFLSDKGYKVPKATPAGRKYDQVEQFFLKEAKKAGKPVSEFDLAIWNEYRSR